MCLNPRKFIITCLLMSAIFALPPGIVHWLWPLENADWWTTSLIGCLVVYVLSAISHPLVAIWWFKSHSHGHGRVAFVFYILAPVLLAWLAFTTLARWSILPAAFGLVFGLDDLYTAAIAMSLPAGGSYDEVFDQHRKWSRSWRPKRQIQVTYPQGRPLIFEPQWPRPW